MDKRPFLSILTASMTWKKAFSALLVLFRPSMKLLGGIIIFTSIVSLIIHMILQRDVDTYRFLYSKLVNYCAESGGYRVETSATTTKFHLLNTGAIFRGDVVNIKIEARDRYYQSRCVGGDFWYTWLSSEENPRASTPGNIIDYGNGTYLVEFLAAWSGHADINIVLIHPSDATIFLKNIIWNAENRIFWVAAFDNLLRTEYSTCTLDASGIKTNKCVYPHPKAIGRSALVCNKPSSLSCSSLLAYTVDPSLIDKRFAELCRGYEYLFFEKNYQQSIYGSISRIYFNESSKTLKYDNLRNSQAGGSPRTINGYWLEEKWNPLTLPKFNCWTDWTLIPKCLQNKHIHILGDSNGRQYMILLAELLGTPNENRKIDTQAYLLRYFDDYNISLDFQFHPEAISSAYIYVADLKYEVDVFDSFTSSKCDYVIIVSTWAHFAQWTRAAFLERLLLLKQAVMRFRKRCPNVPIIFKSPHPREHRTFSSILFSNDFILNEIRKLIREVFDKTGIMYLDVWDMNLAYLSPNNVHMPYTVVREEVFMILTYVCDSMCKD